MKAYHQPPDLDMNRIVLPLALAVLLPGCWLNRRQTNAPLPVDSVRAIETGSTTAGEVVDLLGAPTEVVQLGRRSAYRFDHTTEKGALMWLGVVVVGNNDTRQDRVWVWFDENDVVTHVAGTFQAADAEYSMPWSERE
jgi:outer membrane protein assembly factor BamE (lipoprotein component of BamABCDE complex)